MSRGDSLMPTLVSEASKIEKKRASLLGLEDFQLGSVAGDYKDESSHSESEEEESDNFRTFTDPRIKSTKEKKNEKRAKRNAKLETKLFSIEDRLNALMSEDQKKDKRKAVFVDPENDFMKVPEYEEESSSSEDSNPFLKKKPKKKIRINRYVKPEESEDVSDSSESSASESLNEPESEAESENDLEESSEEYFSNVNESETESSEEEIKPPTALVGDVVGLLSHNNSSHLYDYNVKGKNDANVTVPEVIVSKKDNNNNNNNSESQSYSSSLSIEKENKEEEEDKEWKEMVKEAKKKNKKSEKEVKRANLISKEAKKEEMKKNQSQDIEISLLKKSKKKKEKEERKRKKEEEERNYTINILANFAQQKRRPAPVYEDKDNNNNNEEEEEEKKGRKKGKGKEGGKEEEIYYDDDSSSFDGLPFVPFSTLDEDKKKKNNNNNNNNIKNISPSKLKRMEKRKKLQKQWAKEHPYEAKKLGIELNNNRVSPLDNNNTNISSSSSSSSLSKERERRRASRKILENKGDKKYYKRDRRNPRVFHRHRYEKAMKRIKGRIQRVKEKENVYGGEETGINQRVDKSIHF